ncbi:hypothetical protein MHY1_p00156 (plasmid) [Methylovirgula sp. HY1]|nr:hypothetical protein MHY1_p00156 [Methylovirgula sp. HY1]
MKALLWLRSILSVLTIVGLIFGPVIASTSGSAMAAAKISAMTDGMPCCPHKQPAVPDCHKDCPLRALCMGNCFADVPPLAVLIHCALANGEVLASMSEALPPSCASIPPVRPPRS